jgi:hypothetical protein
MLRLAHSAPNDSVLLDKKDARHDDYTPKARRWQEVLWYCYKTPFVIPLLWAPACPGEGPSREFFRGEWSSAGVYCVLRRLVQFHLVRARAH